MQRKWELSRRDDSGRSVVESYRSWKAGADAFARWLNRIHINNHPLNAPLTGNHALGEQAGRAYGELASLVIDKRKECPRGSIAFLMDGAVFSLERAKG